MRQNLGDEKVLAIPALSASYEKLPNALARARNEKVACSSHVTSSRKGWRSPSFSFLEITQWLENLNASVQWTVADFRLERNSVLEDNNHMMVKWPKILLFYVVFRINTTILLLSKKFFEKKKNNAWLFQVHVVSYRSRQESRQHGAVSKWS